MIKIIKENKTQELPSQKPVGTTFLSIYDGIEHLIVSHYTGYISLTDPSLTWSSNKAFDALPVKYVDIEVKILD